MSKIVSLQSCVSINAKTAPGRIIGPHYYDVLYTIIMDTEEVERLLSRYESSADKRLRITADALSSLVEEGAVDEDVALRILKQLISKHVYKDIQNEIIDDIVDNTKPSKRAKLNFLRLTYGRKETITETF